MDSVSPITWRKSDTHLVRQAFTSFLIILFLGLVIAGLYFISPPRTTVLGSQILSLVAADKFQITTIGGGTGSPIVIRSLILAGFTNISAVSAATDTGGRSGHLRSDERDRVISVSDLLRNLLALISPRHNHLDRIAAFTDLANFTDGRRRNLGYTLYYALLEKHSGNFLAVQQTLEQLLGINFCGQAIPVTLRPTNIHFSTILGHKYVGEHELDRQTMSADTITDIRLSPPVPATPQAISAIAKASHIIYSPGSIYGSVISNFLPIGITAALKKTKAKKILVANLVSNRNQTHRYSPKDYFGLFAKYTRLSRPFDTLICPRISESDFNRRYPEIAATYAAEHSHFHGWTETETAPLTKLGIRVVPADIFSITPKLNRIRHDPQKLARVLKPLIATRT